jgi:hypothetical protein
VRVGLPASGEGADDRHWPVGKGRSVSAPGQQERRHSLAEPAPGDRDHVPSFVLGALVAGDLRQMWRRGKDASSLTNAIRKV